MISYMQLQVINKLLSDDGLFLEPILQRTALSKVQKYYLLQAAINQPCLEFLETLDKLAYQYRFANAPIDWIKSLKRLNDLIQNNEMVDRDYGVKHTHYYCFKNIGENTHELSDPSSNLSCQIKVNIIRILSRVKKKLQPKSSKEIAKYNQFRHKILLSQSDGSWRDQCDLPLLQQNTHSKSYWVKAYDNLVFFGRESQNLAFSLWDNVDAYFSYSGGVIAIEEYEKRMVERQLI